MAAADQFIAATWVPPERWVTWYSGGSRSRLRLIGRPAGFEILALHHMGLQYNVKIVASNDPAGTTLVSLTSSRDPGTSGEILSAMLEAIRG